MTTNDAFDVFARGVAPELTRYCAALLGGLRMDAEDAAQETLLRLWRSGRYAKADRAYIYRVAYNVCMDMHRARRRFKPPELPEPHSVGAGRCAEALLRLSPRDRAVVYLRAVEELDYEEIAARFGRSEVWARKRYSLARARLARLLETGAESIK